MSGTRKPFIPVESDIICSINPANKNIVDRVTVSSTEEISFAVSRARGSQSQWQNTDFRHRVSIIKKAQQLILDRQDSLARIITLEMGRPYVESLSMEVISTVDLMGYYIRNANHFLESKKLPIHNLLLMRRGSRIHIEAIGILGIITPWNWPLLIPMGFIVPALLSGNAIIFKPSEHTPITGNYIRGVFLEAGVPENVFQIIQGYAPAGRALVNSPVDKIFFTGSTEVGRKVMEVAAGSLKDVVLEMGGHDAAIVCRDVNLENCTSGILWGGFNNCGQNCNAIERVYVDEKIAGGFIELLLDKVKRLRVGDGMDSATDMGPLATDAQLMKMASMVSTAADQGAKILTGGRILDNTGGYFFEPTVILWEDLLSQPPDEEIFGPVLRITPVRDEPEAIRLANASRFGLSASIWTSDMKKGQEIAGKIASGSVMINDSVVSFGVAEAGWTGVKNSGVGWVHGQKGFDEMVSFKYICADAQFRSQKFWWFPYGDRMVRAMKTAMVFLFRRKMIERIKVIPRALKYFFSYLVLNTRRKDKW